MKTYEPRRNNECPNGLHATYNPALDPTQNECTCPWLVIASSTPVQHLTSWSRRELENVIRETDRGYFDPPGYPLRSNSMFLSPNMQRLVDMAEKEPVAAALTLLAGAAAHGDSGLPPFDAIAWDAEDACLSLRTGGGGWRRLWLGHTNVDAMTDHDAYKPGGADPVLLWADHPDTAVDVDLPDAGLAATPHEPPQDYYADDFRARPEPLVIGEDGSIPGFDSGYTGPALESIPLPLFAETSAAVPLPQRVPQVPSDIAEAGHGDYCTCDLNLRYTCPTCRTAQADTPISITRGGVRFPIDVPDDVFRAAQVKECGWALVDNAGTFVCTLPADHGNNHSDGGRAWYDSGTDDCTCATRGSAPDTYACPEHPADNV